MSTLHFRNAEREYGHWRIDKIRVVRKPLSERFSFLKSFTAKPMKQHDELYHLYSEFALTNPLTNEKQIVAIEKNQTVKAMVGKEGNRTGGALGDEGAMTKAEEAFSVDPSLLKTKTFGEFIQNTRNYHHHVLKTDMNEYDLRHANCQDFTIAGLRANGLKVTPEMYSFIHQGASELVPNWAGSGLKAITDFAKWGSELHEQYSYTPPDPLRKNYIHPIRAVGQNFRWQQQSLSTPASVVSY